MRVYGLGRLTRELELKSSTSGTSYLTNSIACDRKYGEKKTDFYQIKAFGKTAEAMDKFLHKGSKIFVDGELQTDEYTDKNGIKKQTTSIVVSSWEFAEAKSESKESNESKNDFINIPDSIIEELPFA
jgi:single-strand DNA-binding protein